ncbi:MAG: hypothetical protein M1827_002561 [Pycnora praestabilis]|nr:MAG: hypothetical protein M1827_002561 [Pycnora praestabilis]
MVKYYESIPDDLRDWALAQAVFFTASAPLVGQHVNVSPKGLPASTFTIFDPNHAGYIDATGSGCETISHVYENGRVTIMFCSFETMPRIMRFFCKGRVVEWDDGEFGPLLSKMGKPRVAGARAVILLDIFKVQASCGYAVPLLVNSPTSTEEIASMDSHVHFEDRKTLGHWASKRMEENELRAYQASMNYASLDGLPGLKAARKDRGERLWATDVRARMRRIVSQREALVTGMLIAFVTMLVMRMIGLNLLSLS